MIIIPIKAMAMAESRILISLVFIENKYRTNNRIWAIAVPNYEK
jgi:hypothetical protein